MEAKRRKEGIKRRKKLAEIKSASFKNERQKLKVQNSKIIAYVRANPYLGDSRDPRNKDRNLIRKTWKYFRDISGVPNPCRRFHNLQTSYNRIIVKGRPSTWPHLKEMQSIDFTSKGLKLAQPSLHIPAAKDEDEEENEEESDTSETVEKTDDEESSCEPSENPLKCDPDFVPSPPVPDTSGTYIPNESLLTSSPPPSPEPQERGLRWDKLCGNYATLMARQYKKSEQVTFFHELIQFCEKYSKKNVPTAISEEDEYFENDSVTHDETTMDS